MDNRDERAPRSTTPRPYDESEIDVERLDDPNALNPDVEPGIDVPEQRPLTDNKAGG